MGTAEAPLVPSLSAAVRRVLQHGGAGAGYLLGALPLDAAALQALAVSAADAEASAAEEAALEWQRLLPVLRLASSPSSAGLASSLFQVAIHQLCIPPLDGRLHCLGIAAKMQLSHPGFQVQCGGSAMQVPCMGMPAPASVLASLMMHASLDTPAQTEILRGLKALAEACAHAMNISFASIITHSGGAAPQFTPLFCCAHLEMFLSCKISLVLEEAHTLLQIQLAEIQLHVSTLLAC
jgi:hypothetical protein